MTYRQPTNSVGITTLFEHRDYDHCATHGYSDSGTLYPDGCPGCVKDWAELNRLDDEATEYVIGMVRELAGRINRLNLGEDQDG